MLKIMTVLAGFLCLGTATVRADMDYGDGPPSIDDSWTTIRNNRQVRVLNPIIQLQHPYGTYSASIFDVCLKDNKLRLIGGFITICKREEKFAKGSILSRCTEQESVFPEAPALISIMECAEWLPLGKGGIRCIRTQKRMLDYSQPQTVAVAKLVGIRPSAPKSMLGPILFEKSVSVPVCPISAPAPT